MYKKVWGRVTIGKMLTVYALRVKFRSLALVKKPARWDTPTTSVLRRWPDRGSMGLASQLV